MNLHRILLLSRSSITEIQVFESVNISVDTFEKIKEENKVLPEFLNEFTTNFWEEF